MVKVTVKWGKESYDVDLDAGGSVADFRLQLYSLTGVPNDRQKLMCKAWKGVLKDDAAFSGMGLVDGTIITLMGSSEGIPKAVEKVTFVEDLPAHHAVRAGVALPSGLANAGNTCYANSASALARQGARGFWWSWPINHADEPTRDSRPAAPSLQARWRRCGTSPSSRRRWGT